MNEKGISRLLAMPMTLGAVSEYVDYYLCSDEKLLNYSVSLVIEIDELLDKGYTKDEITDMIKKCDFCEKDQELTEEDGEYLRRHSIKMLDIRYDLHEEEVALKKLEKKSKNL